MDQFQCLKFAWFWSYSGKKTDCFCNYPDCPEIPPDVPVRPAPGDFEAMGTFLSNPAVTWIWRKSSVLPFSPPPSSWPWILPLWCMPPSRPVRTLPPPRALTAGSTLCPWRVGTTQRRPGRTAAGISWSCALQKQFEAGNENSNSMESHRHWI